MVKKITVQQLLDSLIFQLEAQRYILKLNLDKNVWWESTHKLDKIQSLWISQIFLFLRLKYRGWGKEHEGDSFTSAMLFTTTMGNDECGSLFVSIIVWWAMASFSRIHFSYALVWWPVVFTMWWTTSDSLILWWCHPYCTAMAPWSSIKNGRWRLKRCFSVAPKNELFFLQKNFSNFAHL